MPKQQQNLIALLSSRVVKSEGLSMNEIAAQTGMGETWISKQLQMIQAQGKLVVSFTSRPGIDGRKKSIPVYSIKK